MKPAIAVAVVTAVAALALPAAGARAQHGSIQLPVTAAPREARQFDFLVGQWELVAEPRVSSLAALVHGTPKLPGTWKAWRGFDGLGIEDEMRLTDGSGNPLTLVHSMRIYDRSSRRWSSSTLDVYRSRFQAATAEWKNGQMTSIGRGTSQDGRALLSRSRFYDIQPASFRWRQDLSYDEGRTWTEGTLKVEARRLAAAARR